VTLGATGDFGADLCRAAIVINISLCLFNLFVPAYPLDGGRIFVSVLLLCGVPVATAAAVTAWVSMFLALLIVALGIYMMQFLTVFVGGWVLMQAYQLYQLVRAGRTDQHPIFAKYANKPPAAGNNNGGGGGGGGIAGALGGGRV
jgi:Zn-dependent protease